VGFAVVLMKWKVAFLVTIFPADSGRPADWDLGLGFGFGWNELWEENFQQIRGGQQIGIWV
jgi:hypothetical protein